MPEIYYLRITFFQVSCPYGTFRLCRSDVFFLHVMQPSRRGSGGWASDEINEVEEEEECRVTNVDEDARTVADLWRYVREEEEEEEDDGFGPVSNNKKKKKPASAVESDALDFRLLMKMSGNACTSKTVNCAPVINIENREGTVVRMPLRVDAVGLVRRTTRVNDAMEVLKGCVQRQLHDMGRSVLSELKMKGTTSAPEVFHLRPEPLGHLCTIVYNRSGKCANFGEWYACFAINSVYRLPDQQREAECGPHAAEGMGWLEGAGLLEEGRLLQRVHA